MAPPRTCRALALAAAFIGAPTIPSAVHAQSTQPAQSPQPAQSTQSPPQPASAEAENGSKLPVSLERIREGIQREPQLKLDFLDPDIPLFRVYVQENAIELEDYWKVGPDTAVSRMVRPSHASRWHHDFLMMTTPKDYLATVPLIGNPVHPVGVPILEISKELKKVFRSAERARIRRQIQEELKEIEAKKSSPTSK